MISKLRDLAKTDYGCVEFTSVTEEDQEISISYWESLEQIKNWKVDAEHQRAQKLGRERWYRDYQVQIIEIVREYGTDK